MLSSSDNLNTDFGAKMEAELFRRARLSTSSVENLAFDTPRIQAFSILHPLETK